MSKHRRHRAKRVATANPAAVSMSARPIKVTGRATTKPNNGSSDSSNAAPEEQAPEEQAEEQAPEEQAPEEQAPEEQAPEEQAPEEQAPDASMNGDIRFPLVSTHRQGDKVRTTGLLVSPHGCGFVHCNAMPRTLNAGIERVAPHIAAIHRGMLRRLGAKQTQRKVAEAFCTRARQGDQNAMAMIALVRDSAKAGNPQAAISFKFMQDFVKKNPVKPGSFGVELCMCVKPDTRSAVSLANGPPLSNPRIRRAIASFGADSDVLLEGMRKWQSNHDVEHVKLAETLDSMRQEILKMGRTIGKARALQSVRRNGPIMAYDRNVAWELGE